MTCESIASDDPPPRAIEALAAAARAASENTGFDREAWLRDIRKADDFIDDDPLSARG